MKSFDEVKRSPGDASFRGFSEESSGFRAFPEEAFRSSALPRSSALFPEPEVYRSLPSQGVVGPSRLNEPVFRSILPTNDPFSIPPPSSLRRQSKSSLDEAVRQKVVPGKELPQIIPSSFSAPLLSLDVEPPPVPGGYLEPSSHFFSRAKPQLLFRELKLALEGMDNVTVDVTTITPKFKLSCVAYKPGEMSLPFMARVFRMDADQRGKRYALELQRRSGDVLHFWEIWSNTKRYFHAKGLLENCKIPPPAVPRPRSISHLDVEVTPEQIQSTVKCLCEMASSEYADVKSQAVQALSKMTVAADASTLQHMASEDCLETLLRAIGSKLEDEHRCAVSALANLGHSSAPFCHSIAAKGGVKSLCALIGASATPQVHRECSRVLRSMALTVGVGMVDHELRKTIQSLSYSQDAFVRQQAGFLVELLRL